ncbi:hypothetical protein [Erythrobacter sp. THAF29]|uniref:hypothetical protein n=1 Tax=Erythrobacter sp. THAF29 TaxID=2587851 RepID=UPI0012687CAF|nr:hypothetical protein [Erythrobacter sp. THAF29]QFT77273.1 hypothetical protein FIU90_06935 [Erythrobacter sp. THAF29]
MKPLNATRIAPLLACALVAACAGASDKYPSLAIRDLERAQGDFTPVEPEPEPIRPVASAGDIAALVARAREAHLEFEQTERRARTLVAQARGRSIESNARQLALVALADLATLRSQTSVPMSELDQLKAIAATTFAPVDEIDDARTVVSALLDDEDDTLNSLWETLS